MIFVPFFLIKNVALFFYLSFYTYKHLYKEGWPCTYSGICRASCYHYDGLHYVHANYNT